MQGNEPTRFGQPAARGQGVFFIGIASAHAPSRGEFRILHAWKGRGRGLW